MDLYHWYIKELFLWVKHGGSISTVDDNSGLISLTYSGFISMVHRGTISMG